MEVCINACHIHSSQSSYWKVHHMLSKVRIVTLSHAVDSVWKVQVCQQLRLNI